MSEHPIHPHYGPCDAMVDNGECYECRRQYTALEADNARLREAIENALVKGKPSGLTAWDVLRAALQDA